MTSRQTWFGAATTEQGRVAAGNGLLSSAAISAGGVGVGYAIAASAPHPPAALFVVVFADLSELVPAIAVLTSDKSASARS